VQRTHHGGGSSADKAFDWRRRANGLVDLIDDSSTGGGIELKGRCRGSTEGVVYSVSASLGRAVEGRGEGAMLVRTVCCACPIGGKQRKCKHAAALLACWRERPEMFALGGAIDLRAAIDSAAGGEGTSGATEVAPAAMVGVYDVREFFVGAPSPDIVFAYRDTTAGSTKRARTDRPSIATSSLHRGGAVLSRLAAKYNGKSSALLEERRLASKQGQISSPWGGSVKAPRR
jgi:hypothetical protein